MKIAPPSRCRSVPSAKRLVPTSSCWDMAYKTYLWDFPVLNAMVSAGSCFPQTPCQAATLSAPIPATVVGSCVSGTPLPFLHLGWRARLCFAAACSGCFAFCFCFFCDKQVSTSPVASHGCPPLPLLSLPVDCATRRVEGGLLQPQLTLSGFVALQAASETAGGSLGCRDMHCSQKKPLSGSPAAWVSVCHPVPWTGEKWGLTEGWFPVGCPEHPC